MDGEAVVEVSGGVVEVSGGVVEVGAGVAVAGDGVDILGGFGAPHTLDCIIHMDPATVITVMDILSILRQGMHTRLLDIDILRQDTRMCTSLLDIDILPPGMDTRMGQVRTALPRLS